MAEGSVHSVRKAVAPYAFWGVGLAWISQSFEPLDQGAPLRLDDTLGALSMGAGVTVSPRSGRLGISPELRMVSTDHSDEVSGYFGAQGVILVSYRF